MFKLNLDRLMVPYAPAVQRISIPLNVFFSNASSLRDPTTRHTSIFSFLNGFRVLL